jgi:hypothetical protein
MRFAFIGLLFLSSFAVHAQEADCATPTEEKLQPMIAVAAAAADEACPNKARMKSLCGMVSNRVKDSSGRNKWLYQSRILDAACVSENDSASVKEEKIRKAWSTFEPDLVCSGAQFDVTKGSLIKWGVSYQFDDFINDVLKWKVNLNKVDEADGRTVLDYIKFHVDRNKGNAMEPVYQAYYDKLKSAGAKHKSEL